MTSEEFTYWQAFENIEPGDPVRSDLHAAQICLWVYTMMKGKDSPNLSLDYFVLSLKKAKENLDEIAIQNKVRMQVILGC